ncbi:MAG: hypothetical protein AAGF11_23765 [Myxococcota bacterium]
MTDELDKLLEELEAVGTVESVGEFTLDRGKARDKMRRFQLADPRSYVLELVQAASLKGARRIRFDIDSRDMKMGFDGRPFTADDFDDIYGAAFTRRLDRDVLARKQLALGVNSAMALRPTRITVESGDGEQGARLTLEPEQEDSFEAVKSAVCGTTIHVRERFGLGTFVAFFKNLAGTLAEEQLLVDRCGYASLEIDLEGRRLDHGLNLDRYEVLEPIEVHTEHASLVCGLGRHRAGPIWLEIVKDGVLITTHRLSEERFTAGFVAVVQDHVVHKDVSQSDIVRDAAYISLLDTVELGMRKALVRLAQEIDDEGAPDWAESELLRQMRRLARRDELLSPKEPSGLATALRGLALWETTDQRWLTFEELRQEIELRGTIPYVVGNRYDELRPPERSFVLYFTRSSGVWQVAIEVLRTVFGAKLQEVSSVLERQQAREQARKAWRARPMEPVLPTAAYLVRRPFEVPGVRGELGITAATTQSARFAFIVDGCLLEEQEVELPLLGLRVVLTADAFEPARSYERLSRTRDACVAVLLMIGQLPALYGELAPLGADRWGQACAMSFLETVLSDESPSEIVAGALDFYESILRSARTQLGAASPDRAFELSLDTALDTARDTALDTAEPHPVATMPLYRTLGPRRYSLAQLVQRARNDERLVVVDRPVAGIEADILVLTDEQIETIESLFPREFEDGWPQVRRLQHRRDFMARPERPPLTQRAGAVVVPVQGSGIEGQLSVVPRAGHPLTRRPIEVIYERRTIDRVQVLLAGDCEGWVRSGQVHPKADYSGVKQGGGLDKVRAAILEAFARACLMLADRARARMSVDEQAFLREVVALVFPRRPFRLAYDKIARSKDVDDKTRAKIYRWLYAALQTTDDVADLDRRMWRLTQSKTPVADAMSLPVRKRAIRWALTAVDVLFPPGDGPVDLADRALRPVDSLASLPLLQRHDGRSVSVEAMRDYLAGRRRLVLHVDSLEDLDLGDRLALVADEVHREHLRCMLGSQLLNGAGVLERERKKKQIAQRTPVDRIAVAPADALVSTRWQETIAGRSAEGEVGLAREHDGNPDRKPTVSVMAYRNRRWLGERIVEDRPFSLVAAVDHGGFNISYDAEGVYDDRLFRAVVRQCESVAPQLILALARRWPPLEATVRTTAWRHVLDYLVAEGLANPEQWVDTSSLAAPLAAAAQVPGFRRAGGPSISLAAVAEVFVRRKTVEVLPELAIHWGDSPFGPERPLVCVDGYERSALEALFGTLTSVEEQWGDWQAYARNREAAREQRQPRPADCLVFHDIHTPLVQGRLAILARAKGLELDLCAEGRLITTRAVDDVMPCGGSVSGGGIVPDARWASAIIDSEAQAVLRAGSRELYRKLGRWFVDNPVHQRRSGVASLLSRQVVELRSREREGVLGADDQQLLTELRPLPVLALRSGRRLSLQTALEEQPDELGHLDLWESAAHRLLRMFDERDVEGSPGVPTGPALVEPAPTPEPPPAPTRPPTPEEHLLDDVRAELSLVRARNHALLSDVHLDRIVVEPLDRRRRALVAHADASGVVINRAHPVVQRALRQRARDPIWVSWVSSAVYTALNVWLEEVTDADEMHFLYLMAQLVAEG